MDELTLITKIQKQIKESYQQIGDAMIAGTIDKYGKIQIYDGTGTCLFKNITGYL